MKKNIKKAVALSLGMILAMGTMACGSGNGGDSSADTEKA